jgi:hypothetical protein
MMMNVIERRKRLIEIAKCIEGGDSLSDIDAAFLSGALLKIAEGQDPKVALDIKGKRGERFSKDYQDEVKQGKLMKSYALGWLAGAIAPLEEDGLGLKLEDAIGRIGELSLTPEDVKAFGFTEETLKTYWAKNPDKHEIYFKLPD